MAQSRMLTTVCNTCGPGPDICQEKGPAHLERDGLKGGALMSCGKIPPLYHFF